MDPNLIHPIESAPTGALSPFIPQYMALIQAQGYVRASQRHHFRLLQYFDAWLTKRQLTLAQVTESLIEEFLDSRVRAKWIHVSAPATMRRLIAMLRELGAVPASVPALLTPL